MPEDWLRVKLAKSFPIPVGAVKDRAASQIAEFVSLAQPVLLVCVSYYAGAWIGKTFRFPDSHLSLLWPPTAILLAALLLLPKRKWWICLLAVIPAHVLVQVPDGVPGWGIVSQLTGNLGQAVLAALSVQYFNKEETRLFDNFRGVVVFTLGAVIFAPVVVSSIAAYLYVLSGWEQSYWYVWRARVLSNALSTLMIVPPIVSLAGGVIQSRKVEPRRLLEAGLIAAGLSLIALGALRTESAVAVFLYAPLPLLLWAAVRFGIGGLCLSLLATAYLIFLDTSGGQGPFAAKSAAENILSLQLFLITISLPLMLLAVLLQERRGKETAVRESEARYRALVMASADMVWRANARGEGFFVTPSWQEFTGQNENQTRDFGWLEALHPDDRERTKRLWEQAMMERRAYENELRVRARDGSCRHFYVHAVPILAPDGSVHEWVGANVDITERKRAEQALQDLVAGTAVIGKEFFAALVRHVAAALDVNCAVVSELADNKAPSLRTLAIWLNNDWRDNFEYDIAQTPCAEVIREGKTVCYRDRVQELFAGDKYLADINAMTYMGTPLFNSAGRLIGNLCIIDNKRLIDEQRAKSILEIFAARAAGEIERQRAEDSLRESEERLVRTEKVSLVMVAHADLEGRWLKVPPTLCELLGYSEAELLGSYSRAVTHPDDFEAGWRQCQRLIRGEIQSFDLEKRYIHRAGRIVWVYLNCSLVTDSKGSAVQFLAYIRDITERKQTEQALRESEQALRESEERLRLAVESSRMGVWDWDRRANVRKWSREQFSILGLASFGVEPTYRTWAQCIHPEDLPRANAAVEEAIAEKKEYRCEYRVVWPEGTVRWVVGRGEPIYDENGECVRIMGVLVDVTERKQTEEEIRHLKERLEAENVYLRSEVSGVHRYGELLGQSEGIRKVLQQVDQVAGTDMTVLVLGETGTGKELVARGVHGQSVRRERPLVKVNCSALPGDLIESELFGHEKGAFTGATARQVGRFELADGGTIFLDEVGDLPLKLQAKLLRVLQEGEFERLGSGKTIKVDARVIAATNRDLLQAAQRGRFRLDLYYRLNVYPIVLPPLRERQEDIGLLAETFLSEASRRLGRLFEPISEEVLRAFRVYHWPGNVRELQNVIERAAVLSRDRRLQLPEEWASMSFASTTNTSAAAEPVQSADTASQEATLAELERNHILQVLHQTRWRVEGPTGAAKTLGLNPSTLRSRMQKLGIKRVRHAVELPTN